MAIEIKSGPAPVAKPYKSKSIEIYAAAVGLKGGQWFEWPNPPKQLCHAKKKLKELNKDLDAYVDMSGRTIVKNNAATVVESTVPVTPMASVRATPIGGTVGGSGGLTREQREAAAARVRQTANGLRRT